MKAAVYRKFGGPEVVAIEDWPKPVPGDRDVLIKVHATTVSIADYRMRTRDLPKGLGFLAPIVLGVFAPRHKVLGMDLAGVVEAVGAGVTRFKPGDAVIAMPGPEFGAHAEYFRVAETGAIANKPKNLNFEEAAALVFGGQPALVFFKRGKIKAGDEVLVNGGSGSVGTAAVQLARHFGARVTGVTSGGNADLVRSLGAETIVDYTKEDFTANGQRYDIVMDCVGNAPFERVKSSVKPGGAVLLVVSDLKGLLGAGRNARRSGMIVNASPVDPAAEDLAFLSQLAEAGALKPVIDRTYDFADIVEAHRYVDTGRKKGNVVLRIQ